MLNQLFRIDVDGDDKSVFDFFIASTNEINPHRETREMAIVLVDIHNNQQYDGSLNLEQLGSLISYLTACRNNIKDFNENSKPIEE